MKRRILSLVAFLFIQCGLSVATCSTAEAGSRSAKTSLIYPYPGGPQPVRPSHCHRVLVTYEQDVLYTVCQPGYGCYQWIGTRRFQRIETRCHPEHGHYHTQED